MYEKGTGHTGDNGQPDRPAWGNVAHNEIAQRQSGDQDQQGFLAAQSVANNPSAGAGEKIHEGKAGREQAGGHGGEFKGVHKKQGQHGNNRQFGTKGHEVSQIQYRHLFEFVLVNLGNVFVKHMFINLINANALEYVDANEDSINYVAQIARQDLEISGTQFPGEDGERGVHGDIHQQIEKKITLAGDFHRAGFFRFEIGRALRCIGNREKVDSRIDQRQYAGSRQGVAPTIIPAVQQRNGRQAHGGRSRTKIAPAAIDTFGHAQLFDGEPFTDHANANHKAGADKAHQKTHQQKLVVVLSIGKTKTKETGNEE